MPSSPRSLGPVDIQIANEEKQFFLMGLIQMPLFLAALFPIVTMLLACQNETAGSIPIPNIPEKYRGWEDAQSHHCISQDIGFHYGFLEITSASAYDAVGRIYYDWTRDENGNIVEGGYLDPADIESVEVDGATFGELRWGRRLLTLQLVLWVTNPWNQYGPDQSSPVLPGIQIGGRIRPDEVSVGATIVRHYGEGYMDDETCEITYFRSY